MKKFTGELPLKLSLGYVLRTGYQFILIMNVSPYLRDLKSRLVRGRFKASSIAPATPSLNMLHIQGVPKILNHTTNFYLLKIRRQFKLQNDQNKLGIQIMLMK